jgi:hypothetical protein
MSEGKTVEIWIRGRLLCEVLENNTAIEHFEQLVKKAGYTVNKKEEGNKTIIIA